MRHGASGRRSRNRSGGGRGRGNQNRSQVFDSNGPDVRIRGTAHQIYEKYVALAKDADGSGDYILSESYLQHAEHYQRVINSFAESAGQDRQRDNNDEKAEPGNTRDHNRQRAKAKAEDDLGLPPSIVGKADKKTADKDELQDA